MNAACSTSEQHRDNQQESRDSAWVEDESLGCRCLKAAKSAACWEPERPHLPLPRAVLSSASSPDTWVQALLLPALMVVSHTGAWAIAPRAGLLHLEQKEMLGGWVFPPFEGEKTGCPDPLAFSSIHQLWSWEKVDTSRIFHLPENLILICLPWKSETIYMCVYACVCIFSPLFFGTPRRRHLLFRAVVLAGTCPMQHWDFSLDLCHQLWRMGPL